VGGDPGEGVRRVSPRHPSSDFASNRIPSRQIVGGLEAALVLGIFLLPTLYVWVAGDRDVLPEAEVKTEEE
jgi:hypothetical protein